MENKSPQNPKGVSRRRFLSVTTAATAGLGAIGCESSQAANTNSSEEDPIKPFDPNDYTPEWRNRQEGMSYRMLGSTGMMISEIICGGDPVRPGNTDQVEYAIEKGLNYLDMAPAYGGGKCEEAYSSVITSSSKREQVFMTTKVSGYTAVRHNMYKDIFEGLPSEKKNAILKRANELRDARAVDKPGYFLMYWPGQDRAIAPPYLSNAMMPDYAHKVDGSQALKDKITSSLEGSLKRAKTDYFDILMCPHGADAPEDVQMPEINETFQKLKEQGKCRFLGVSTHNDPAGVLRAATAQKCYDVVMCAYNVINGGYMEDAIRTAYEQGMGIIGMKVAMAVATHHKPLQPVPQWRIDKVERIVPGDMKAPMKAYVWALQNPHISAVISNLWDKTFVDENLSLAGMKVELQPG